jgi:erythronate-4-phosphate dehydrogenase
MIVIVDAKNPFLAEALAPHCTVRTLPTAEITRIALKDADAAVVRSETRVDAGLSSTYQFVGTATIGTDHVDTAHLARHGIAFANAPGSNANSVVRNTWPPHCW